MSIWFWISSFCLKKDCDFQKAFVPMAHLPLFLSQGLITVFPSLSRSIRRHPSQGHCLGLWAVQCSLKLSLFLQHYGLSLHKQKRLRAINRGWCRTNDPVMVLSEAWVSSSTNGDAIQRSSFSGRGTLDGEWSSKMWRNSSSLMNNSLDHPVLLCFQKRDRSFSVV